MKRIERIESNIDPFHPCPVVVKSFHSYGAGEKTSVPLS